MATYVKEWTFDDRLNVFLKRFMKGWHNIEFGIFVPGIQYNPKNGEQIPIDVGEHSNLIIRDGAILNGEEIPNVLNILDIAGITDALPEFDGEQMVFYLIDEDGYWVNLEETEEKIFFYVTYHSVN